MHRAEVSISKQQNQVGLRRFLQPAEPPEPTPATGRGGSLSSFPPRQRRVRSVLSPRCVRAAARRAVLSPISFPLSFRHRVFSLARGFPPLRDQEGIPLVSVRSIFCGVVL
jgi:hypothetical protein